MLDPTDRKRGLNLREVMLDTLTSQHNGGFKWSTAFSSSLVDGISRKIACCSQEKHCIAVCYNWTDNMLIIFRELSINLVPHGNLFSPVDYFMSTRNLSIDLDSIVKY